MAEGSVLVFFLNNKKVELSDFEPDMTLLEYLRSADVRLTSVKKGCNEGGCGACTLCLQRIDGGKVLTRAINSCLFPMGALHGCHVITAEFLKDHEALHPVPERIAKFHGSQCGYCTPGVVMSLYSLLRANPEPKEHDIEDALDGNLCRCTGYRPIMDAARTFVKKEKCCGKCTCKHDGDGHKVMGEPIELKPYDPALEPTFPEELRSLPQQPLLFKGSRVLWYHPLTLDAVKEWKTKHPEARLIVGNTEVALETHFKRFKYPVMLFVGSVPEMLGVRQLDNGVFRVGASESLTKVRDALKVIQEQGGLAGAPTSTVSAIIEQLRWFAGAQVRNVACLGGNLVTASPISDMNPIWMALGATMEVKSTKGTRMQSVRDFFTGYRKVALDKEEFVVALHIPALRPHEYVVAYKQARRRDDDIAIVSACFRVLLEPQGNTFVVKEAGMGFGGMAAVTKAAPLTEEYLVGKTWNHEMLEEAYKCLEKDLPLAAGAPGGMIGYRRALTTSFFFKFFMAVSKATGGSVAPEEEDAAIPCFPGVAPLRGHQDFSVPPGERASRLHLPIMHMSAEAQTVGTAVFTDDMRLSREDLYAAPVFSTHAYAKLISIDASKGLKMEGVRGWIDASSVPGKNAYGIAGLQDERVFAEGEVHSRAALIGLMLGNTERQARAAADQVVVKYEELGPPILTIDQAVERKSFYDVEHCLEVGSVDAAFERDDVVIVEGITRSGGQEHFYLETMVNYAVPGENGELIIHTSSQAANKTQMIIASAIGVRSNKIVCKVKRAGGAFGGKETRSVPYSVAVAVAAHVSGLPVRMQLERDVDMEVTGGRHPFRFDYKVAVTKEGKLVALQMNAYSNGGYTRDLSIPILDRSLFHSENCYRFPHVRVVGRICKTNLPSNTAYRGFGAPQAMLAAEQYIEHIASVLQMDPNRIREINMYNEGEITPFLQELEFCNIRECWEEVRESSNYEERERQVAEFNKKHRFVKRGIAVVPTKFGISFTAKFMNQAGALVHVYSDGDVLVTHGGVEMGQGLHTKVAQVAAEAFNISLDHVHISETATDKVANSQPSAASASSDLYGEATHLACMKIKGRMDEVQAKMKDGETATFAQVASAAFYSQVDLSAHGFYATPDVGYDWVKHEGRPFNYFTFGAAVSEVEIDTLTGDHRVLRSDVLLDLGRSLNPALDVGQIEGAFMQGLGWATIEELVWNPNGSLFTKGPGMYKIPSQGNVPRDFRVSLLKNKTNPRAIHASKAVGEPPFFLATSAFLAIRHAIGAARGDGKHFALPVPATCERIRMACMDRHTEQFAADGPPVCAQ